MAKRNGGLVKQLEKIREEYHKVLNRMTEIRTKDPKGIPFNAEYHKLNLLRADYKRQIRHLEEEK